MSMFATPADALDARSELEVVNDQHAWYRRVRDPHMAYVEAANRNERFYLGDQWDEADVARLRAERRPHLTINMVMSTVNLMIGEYANKTADVAFEPVRGGSEATAQVLSKLWKDIANRTGYGYEERDVYEDGLILRRGWFDVRIDTSSNMMGEVSVKALDPREVIIDPDGQKYDPTTWSFVGRTWWANLTDIALDYNLDQAQIDRLTAAGGTGPDGASGLDHIQFLPTTFGGEDNTMWNAQGGEDAALYGRKVYRVLEREYYVRAQVHYFVDPRSGDTRKVPDHWSSDMVAAFAAEHELTVDTRIGRRIRWTVTCGDVVLRDIWSPYRSFTKRPYFPYFRRGNPVGLVDNLISPQEQVNKIASQELHVINTTANSGWMVPKGALTNMTVDELKAHGSSTGVVLEYNQTKGSPVKIQPNQIPAALDRAEQKALQNISLISGTELGPSRDPQQTPNGQTVEFLRDRTQTKNQVVLENLARTREMVVHKVLELVQDFMPQERVVTAVVDADEVQEVVINQVTAAGEIINDVTKGEYKAVITMIPARDTYRENQMIEAMALMSQGVPIRQERLVKLSSLADRAQVAEEVAQDLGRGPVSPEQQQKQQVMEQAQMQTVMLQVQELAAKIQELQSQAQLNMAKASASEAMVEVATSQIEADVQTARENNSLRESLATLNAAAKMDKASIDAQTRVALQHAKEQSKQAPNQASAMTAPPAAGPSSEEYNNGH